MNPQLLFFGLDQIQTQRATAAANQAEAQPVFIPPNEYNKTIGSFVGLPHTNSISKNVLITEPVILICGATDQQLHQILLALRAHNLGSIIKAVLTPANAGWNIGQLLSHLQQERAAYAANQQPDSHQKGE